MAVLAKIRLSGYCRCFVGTNQQESGEVGQRVRYLRLKPTRLDDRPRTYQPAPFAAAYVAMLFVGAAGALLAYLVLHQVDPRAARLDVAKTALAVVAGSGAGAALYVSYRGQRNAEANTVREQDKLFTERYTQAVAQLGHSSPAIRVGGVTALARIADDSERDRPTCLTLLCTYLRIPNATESDSGEQEVRSTAQSELAERLRPTHPGYWPDARIDLTGAQLHDLDFSNCVLGESLFDNAAFTGTTRFHQTTFGGNTWFTDARFGTKVRFKEAVFKRKVGFLGAEFPDDTKFDDATFNPDDVPLWPDGFGEPEGIKWATQQAEAEPVFHLPAWPWNRPSN